MLRTMQVQPDTAQKIVLASCVLHNMILTRYPRQIAAEVDREDPLTHEIIRGAWRDELGDEITLRLVGHSRLSS